MLLAGLAVLLGTGLFVRYRMHEAAERQVQACRDRVCPDDRLPSYDTQRLALFKVNGQFFTVARDYGGFNATLRFYWPGGQPANAPLPAPPGAGLVEVFLRSEPVPDKDSGYRLIQLAQQRGWIARRELIGPGNERLYMRHVVGPDGYWMDTVVYYVARDLTGPDGLPPTATCGIGRDSVGGTLFQWRPGIWAGTRWDAASCNDFPAIYRELQVALQHIQEL